jgi:GTPase involved in cell partitioning and DNA repair
MKIFNKSMLLAIGVSALCACQQEVNYKDVRAEVMDFHDRLMNDDGNIMANKMKLDTLAMPASLAKVKAANASADTAKVHAEVDSLRNALTAAEDKMSNWMENFKTDADGKSNEQAVAYFKSEKKKVQSIDSLYQTLLKQSGDYLKKFNMAPAETHGGEHQH